MGLKATSAIFPMRLHPQQIDQRLCVRKNGRQRLRSAPIVSWHWTCSGACRAFTYRICSVSFHDNTMCISLYNLCIRQAECQFLSLYLVFLIQVLSQFVSIKLSWMHSSEQFPGCHFEHFELVHGPQQCHPSAGSRPGSHGQPSPL